MQKSTRFLCAIFGFFLMLALLIPQLTIALRGQLLNWDGFYDRICTPANAEETIDLILDDGCFVADSCGISHSVFDGVFTTDVVLQDMQQALSAALRNDLYTPDTGDAMTLLAENVRQNLRELEQIEDTAFYEEDITTFCKQIDGIYYDYVNLKVFDYLSTIEHYASLGFTAMWVVFAVLAVLMPIMMWILLRDWGLLLREIAFSAIGSGGMMAALSAYLLFTAPFSRIMLAPLFLREIIRALFHDTVMECLLAALAMLAVGCLLFALAALLIRKKSKHHPSEDPKPTQET